MKIDGWLLDILACPQCHAPLRADDEASELVCTNPDCGLAFPVRDDIPVLLIDEARRPGEKAASPAGEAPAAEAGPAAGAGPAADEGPAGGAGPAGKAG